ncbi:MAG: GNAT family N-acetyltransferase [Candidatus Thorarchaeota archaeon]
MDQELTVNPLDLDHVDMWLRIHQATYGQYPWPKSITRSDVLQLISTPDMQPMIAFSGQYPVGIAVLEKDSESHNFTLKDFACSNASLSLVKTFLHHIVSQSRELDAISLNTWVWDSEQQVLSSLIEAGFVLEQEHSLISRRVMKTPSSSYQDTPLIRSLSEGITIHDFVKANREAFHDDPSQPLEESELESWVSEEEGFHPNLQLAYLINDSIVGTTMCEIFSFEGQSGQERHAWIHGLGVVKDHRRRGVARSLVDELMHRLNELSVTELWLFTDTEGPIREFYNRLGFLQRVNWVDLTLYFGQDS